MKLLKRLVSSPPMGGMIVAMLFALGAIGVGALEQAFPLSTTAGTIFVRGPLPAGLTRTVGTGTATGVPSSTLTSSSSSTCTIADTNATDLWAYTLPANTLSANGQAVRVTAIVKYAATANIKTIALNFGGTTIASRGPSADNAPVIVLMGTVWRTGAATQQTLGLLGYSLTAAQQVFGNTAAETLSSSLVIRVVGTNGTAAANDICIHSAVVESIGR